MSDKTTKRYRIFLGICLSVIFTLIAIAVGLGSYRCVNEINRTKPSVAYDINDVNYKVYPSGEPIGIYVKTKGVMVTTVCSFVNSDGVKVSPCEDVVQKGDYISKIDGVDIENKADFMDKLAKAGDKEICLDLFRDNIRHKLKVRAQKAQDGTYKLGIWIKDDISGIGTLTFVDKTGFAALGHSINDIDTGEIFRISEGAIYNAKLMNIRKPEENTPGRLEGIIDYAPENMIGKVSANEYYGISGYLTSNYHGEIDDEWVGLGTKDDICIGEAYIISCVSGKREKYTVMIDKINLDASKKEKNIEIHVTDERLLNMTGGIVQGMSGSPIIQNGKLIGAVTHVFVNDSSRGYGIMIEEMLK